MSLLEKIKNLAKQNQANNVTTRRYLHAHPELSYQEFETSKFIQAELIKMARRNTKSVRRWRARVFPCRRWDVRRWGQNFRAGVTWIQRSIFSLNPCP